MILRPLRNGTGLYSRAICVACALLLSAVGLRAQDAAGAVPESAVEFTPPDFLKPLFDIDSVFLEPGEVQSLTEALSAVASNFPGNPKVTPKLRAKALAVALRLDGVHLPSATALERLQAGTYPDPVAGFDQPAEAAAVLWGVAEALDSSDASNDDHLLACSLMDVAARIDPTRSGGLERFQKLQLRSKFSWGDVLGAGGKERVSFPRDPKYGGGGETRPDRPDRKPDGPGDDTPPSPGPDGDGGEPGGGDPAPAGPVKLVKSRASGNLLVLDPRVQPPVGMVTGMEVTTIVGALENPMTVRFLDVDGQEVEGLERVAAFIPAAVVAAETRWPKNGGSMTVSLNGYYDPINGEGVALPSALLARSLVTGEEFQSDVAVVGGIGEDGTVEGVGGLLARLRDLRPGVPQVVVMPADNFAQLVDLAVLGELAPLVERQLFVVANLKSAAMLAFEQPAAIVEVRRQFAEIQGLAGTMPVGDLAANAKVQERLAEIVAVAPGHASARILLLIGRGELPKALSREGSVYALEQAAVPVLRVLQGGGEPFVENPARLFSSTRSTLSGVRSKLHRSCTPVADLLVDLVAKIEAYSALNNRASDKGKTMLTEIRESWEALREAYRGLHEAGG